MPMAPEANKSSFIARRWNTSMRAYVDSNNKKLPGLELVSKDSVSGASISSIPPADGSAPFLRLPTELRLHIYDYLMSDTSEYHQIFIDAFGLAPSRIISYTYLYRSPGRVTKPSEITKHVIDLFHVCKRMRDELIDAYFSEKIFVLEASLYRRDAGGLSVLPPNLGATAWVKRLHLFTVVEVDGMVKGIADLRPLQQMVNLRELQIIYTARTLRKGSTPDGYASVAVRRPDNIFKAILECVPDRTVVHFKRDDVFLMSFPLQLDQKALVEGTCNEHVESDPGATFENMRDLYRNKGKLSGSAVNHALCSYNACLEGLDCVNSQLETLTWRPPPGTGLSLQTELQMAKAGGSEPQQSVEPAPTRRFMGLIRSGI